MMLKVLNINQGVHTTTTNLQEMLPKVSEKIASRRMRLTGTDTDSAQPSKRVLSKPTHGRFSQGHPTSTNVDIQKKDAETLDVLGRCMEDQDNWRCSWRVYPRTTEFGQYLNQLISWF